MNSIFIFYVTSQEESTDFYSYVLNDKPVLFVPGMSEFKLGENSSLGLMPSSGIKKLLGEKLPDPDSGKGIPRAELYLRVPDPENYHTRVLEKGGVELSPLLKRNWGEEVAYSLDQDGNVLAFAKIKQE